MEGYEDWLTQNEEQVEREKRSEKAGRLSCSHRMRHLNFTSKVEQFQVMNEKV